MMISIDELSGVFLYTEKSHSRESRGCRFEIRRSIHNVLAFSASEQAKIQGCHGRYSGGRGRFHNNSDDG